MPDVVGIVPRRPVASIHSRLRQKTYFDTLRTQYNARSPSLSPFLYLCFFFYHLYVGLRVMSDVVDIVPRRPVASIHSRLRQKTYFDTLRTQYTARSPLLPLLFYLTFLFYSLLGGLRVISGVADIVSRRPALYREDRLHNVPRETI